MYAAVDATEEDMQPIRDRQIMIVWFFMLFMLVGSYLVMNLFVGVIIDNFNKVGAYLPASYLHLHVVHVVVLSCLHESCMPADLVGLARYDIRHAAS